MVLGEADRRALEPARRELVIDLLGETGAAGRMGFRKVPTGIACGVTMAVQTRFAPGCSIVGQ